MVQLKKSAFDTAEIGSKYAVPEDASRLFVLQQSEANCGPDSILAALKRDQVVLIKNASPLNADNLIASVAESLGLRHSLNAQAAFADIQGHRKNVGKHFMSVNLRTDYQFIPPHSEGRHNIDMQLASLYGYENSTDGGFSVLLNVNSNSPMWEVLRCHTTKVDLCGRKLSASEIAGTRAMYQIYLPEDLLNENDHVLSEQESPVPGVKLFNVLTKPQKSYSRILERHIHVFWDNVANADFDSGKEYLQLLRDCSLLKEPVGGLPIEQLDNAHDRHVWNSGVRYASLFISKITHKLTAGDLLIQNNLSWTHSSSNWTPGSGNRKVVAAFA